MCSFRDFFSNCITCCVFYIYLYIYFIPGRFSQTVWFTTFTTEPPFSGWMTWSASLVTYSSPLPLSLLYFFSPFLPGEVAKNIFSQTVKSGGERLRSQSCQDLLDLTCLCVFQKSVWQTRCWIFFFFFFLKERKNLWKALTRSSLQVCDGVRSFLTALMKPTGGGGRTGGRRLERGKDRGKQVCLKPSNVPDAH